jgi:hypothetical protein
LQIAPKLGRLDIEKNQNKMPSTFLPYMTLMILVGSNNFKKLSKAKGFLNENFKPWPPPLQEKDNCDVCKST